MSKIFSGQVYLIDNNIQRISDFKANLFKKRPNTFFYHFSSAIEAFDFAVKDEVMVPNYIYIHAESTNIKAKIILRKVKNLDKTKEVKVIVFGKGITNDHHRLSMKYNFELIDTPLNYVPGI